jgi:bifunctional DNA-binding transcriptional regulator/antitoxin component of YhaV-PrlF toxin-antitoxin module
MKRATISVGGQIQVPAEVRRRWGTREVLVADEGDAFVVRPLPKDAIGAALGSLKGAGPSSDDLRRQLREEEAEISDRSRGA